MTLSRRRILAIVAIAAGCGYALGFHVGGGVDVNIDGKTLAQVYYPHVFNKECDYRTRDGMVIVNWLCDSTGHRPIRTDSDE